MNGFDAANFLNRAMVLWPVLLFSLSLHEFFHAWMADRLGDSTARYSGRLTINPIAHFDPIGTTMALVVGFGWAKPVPVNAVVFRWPKRDMMLTALAGPASNFALAIVFTIALKLLLMVPYFGDHYSVIVLLRRMAEMGVWLNLGLGLFNLLPFFPLDGHHILRGFLSFRAALQYDRMKNVGMIGLVVFLMAGSSVLWGVSGFLGGLLFRLAGIDF